MSSGEVVLKVTERNKFFMGFAVNVSMRLIKFTPKVCQPRGRLSWWSFEGGGLANSFVTAEVEVL